MPTSQKGQVNKPINFTSRPATSSSKFGLSGRMMSDNIFADAEFKADDAELQKWKKK